jgi:hypothetical protein
MMTNRLATTLALLLASPLPAAAQGRGDFQIAPQLGAVAKGTGFAMEGWFVWCGAVIKVGADYHMFASRWPEATKFPDGYRAHSEIVRAVAPRPEGPFVFQEVVIGKREAGKWDSGMAHNPAIYRTGATFVLYYIGSDVGSRYRQIGIATAPAITGPWTRRDQPLDLGVASDANNPSACFEPDGSVKLIWRTVDLRVCISTARTYAGPYTLANGNAWPAARLEDFFFFQRGGEYHVICEDNVGKVTGHERWGAHLFSADGVTGWKPWREPVAYDHRIRWTDGGEFEPRRRERPWFLIEDGALTYLYTAVYDGQRTWNQPVPLLSPAAVSVDLSAAGSRDGAGEGPSSASPSTMIVALEKMDRLFVGFPAWLASLYDKQSGGFFFERSAVDNPAYPPTIESTSQALSLLYAIGGEKNMPAEFRQRLIRFYQSRQDPLTGYFIDDHPNRALALDSRTIARAQAYVRTHLKKLGATPEYALPGEPRTSATSARGARPAAEPSTREAGDATARVQASVKHIRAKPPVATDAVATQYGIHSTDDLRRWLENLPWHSPWSAGQKISDLSEFLRYIDGQRRSRYLETIWAYLEGTQDPDTGFWGRGSGYTRLSGAMKIKSVYYGYDRPMPRALQIFRSMIACMTSETTPNVMPIRNALENMSTFLAHATAEERIEMRRSIPRAVLIASNLLPQFLRTDGGFSWGFERATAHTGGHKIGGGRAEGDTIGSSGALLIRNFSWQLSGLPIKSLNQDYAARFYSELGLEVAEPSASRK